MIIEHRHFRRVHPNSLHANSMLDLVVFGRHAADTTVAFRADTTAEFHREREMMIEMASLDDAGKTTALYRMMLDTAVTAIPAIGFNVECAEH